MPAHYREPPVTPPQGGVSGRHLAFKWMLGTQLETHMLTQHTLYQLSHLPIPPRLVFVSIGTMKWKTLAFMELGFEPGPHALSAGTLSLS